MLLTRSTRISLLCGAPRRQRPANPSCRGGASSLLRLTQPVAPRLPTTVDLRDWMGRAASELLPVTGPLSDLQLRVGATGTR